MSSCPTRTSSTSSASGDRIDFFRPGSRSHSTQLSSRVQSWAVATNEFTRPLVGTGARTATLGNFYSTFLNWGVLLIKRADVARQSTSISVTVDVIGSASMDIGIWSANNSQPGTELFSLPRRCHLTVTSYSGFASLLFLCHEE